MTTERIAQTFPDINSQGLNTSGTAAGIRSFPDPFVAVAGQSGVLVQRGVITVAPGSLTGSLVIATPVDVTRSFVVFAGQIVKGSTIVLSSWRVHLAFTSIAAGFSDEVLATRALAGVGLDISFSVVSYTGTAGSSIDVKVADVGPAASPPFCFSQFPPPSAPGPYDFTNNQRVPNTSGIFGTTVASARVVDPATGLDLDLGVDFSSNSFTVFRGLEFTEVGASNSTPPSSRFHPEQWHGELTTFRSSAGTPPPNSASGFATGIQYRNYQGGSNFRTPAQTACGSQCIGVYASLVWFPPPG